MHTKEEITANWLPRYTKRELSGFGEYILLTNFEYYVELFAQKFQVPILGQDANMTSATADNITIINFAMGSPNAATIMDLLSTIQPKACLFLGKCGGINRHNNIVDFILQSCTDSKSNIEELYRRVAFNICIGNSDDHFRNHGFLLTPKGWTLSPVYDLNPTLNDFQTLLINSKTNEADLGILLDSYQEYMINRSTAENIIKKVVDSVSQWEVLARNIHVPKYEIDLFREKFSKNKKT